MSYELVCFSLVGYTKCVFQANVPEDINLMGFAGQVAWCWRHDTESLSTVGSGDPSNTRTISESTVG